MSDISFETAVTVYGTNILRAQCYLQCDKSGTNELVDSLDTSWTRYTLSNEQARKDTLLLEKNVTTLMDFATESIRILTWLSMESSVSIAAMIFDGGYFNSDVLFSEEALDQVYGFYAPSFGPLLTLDRDVMRSLEWCNLLRKMMGTSYAGASSSFELDSSK